MSQVLKLDVKLHNLWVGIYMRIENGRMGKRGTETREEFFGGRTETETKLERFLVDFDDF